MHMKYFINTRFGEKFHTYLSIASELAIEANFSIRTSGVSFSQNHQ